jgi:hypothetical protein
VLEELSGTSSGEYASETGAPDGSADDGER